MIPKKYCEELMHLCSDVEPMPFEEVEVCIRDAWGQEWKEVLKEIEAVPLGSASIAQVHKAVLKTGESVVVKVQRRGIDEIMARDIALLRKAVGFIPPLSIKGMVNPEMILDELWAAAKEELDFLKEYRRICREKQRCGIYSSAGAVPGIHDFRGSCHGIYRRICHR